MNSTMFWTGALAALIAIGIWLVRRSFFRVEEGTVGVVKSFGAAEHVSGDEHRLRTWPPGIHMKWPWETAICVELMEKSVDLSGERGRTAMAADGTKLRFDSILRYQAVEARLSDYLFGMRNPREHVTGLFTCLLRNEIANFGVAPPARPAGDAAQPTTALARPKRNSDRPTVDMGSFAQLRRERAQLNKAIAEFCHEQIGDRYGIHFNAVDLVDILPPDELAVALNAVIHAESEAGARYFRAEGDCQQQLLAAEEGLAIARTRAMAVEQEMRTLSSYLAKLDDAGTLALYVERRRAEVLGEAKAVYVQAPLSI
ncbi:MAG: SPFH domain-containing protein [Polyangiaceae bacterium]|nr:SPFH domain-containing protein [Polyangiaceae bacterium]